MSHLFQELRLALRGLRRRPGFSLTVILTLGLGIGVNLAILSLVQSLLLQPLPFPEADRLVRVMALKGSDPGRLSQREIEGLQRETQTFDSVAAYYLSQYNFTGNDRPVVLPCAIGSHEMFEVLGSRFVLGGPFGAKEDFRRQYRVVLTYDLWQRHFAGDPDIVGSSIQLDGGSYVIDGVLEDAAAFPSGVQLYRQVTEYHGLDGRRYSAVARLRPDVGLEQAGQALTRFTRDQQASFPELGRGIRFEPVSLRDAWIGPARPYLWMLTVAVAFVLLIAIFNAVHLLLARAGERRNEMAIRVSLGAGRRQLVRRLLIENLLTAAIGGLVGILTAVASLRLLTSLLHDHLPLWLQIRLHPSMLIAAVVLTVFSGLVAGGIPAFSASDRALQDSLRSGSRGSAGRRAVGLRGALMTAEIALALVLLTGAGLMVRSFMALDRQDLGFQADNLLTFRVDPPYWGYNKVEQLTPFFEQTKLELEKIPGIHGVAVNQNLPLAGLDAHTKLMVTLEGQSVQDQANHPFVHLQSVGPGYFDVMGIAQRQGRDFGSQDRQGGQPVAIVGNRLAQRLWPDGEPLGRRLKLGPPEAEAPWLTVVGVVDDVRSENRTGNPALDLYVSHFQHFTGDTYFALRTELEGADVRRQVAAAILRVDPDLPIFDVAPMDERIARVEWQRLAAGRIFAAFGLLALALAAFGIYGVMSYQVGQRTRELGIRQAFGATPRDLAIDVVRRGLGFFLVGTAIGVPAAFGFLQLIRNLLFGISSRDPWSALTAWLVLLAALLLACIVPARRAAKLDPLPAMRKERV